MAAFANKLGGAAARFYDRILVTPTRERVFGSIHAYLFYRYYLQLNDTVEWRSVSSIKKKLTGVLSIFGSKIL